MRKLVSACALAIGSWLSLGAHAAPLTLALDTFDSGDQVVVGTNSGASDANAVRTLSMQLLNTVPPVNSTATVSNGYLDINNGSMDNSFVTVSWNFAAGALPVGATNIGFVFKIIGSDSNPTDISFTLDGGSIANFSIPSNTVDEELTFSIADGLLDAGGLLAMTLTGQDGWDMAIDFVNISYEVGSTSQVPEPDSLALLATALLGLVAIRRRKS